MARRVSASVRRASSWNSRATTGTCCSFLSRGIPVLGVEPAANVAKVAVEERIPTLVQFFGRDTATGMVADGKRQI